MLFNIRAGNTQIAMNIIVSIINFALLPTVGAISDYTRYRFHVGCLALVAVCCCEFVSASASVEVHSPPPCPANSLGHVGAPACPDSPAQDSVVGGASVCKARD